MAEALASAWRTFQIATPPSAARNGADNDAKSSCHVRVRRSGIPQVKNRFCARICARDAAGRDETGET